MKTSSIITAFAAVAIALSISSPSFAGSGDESDLARDELTASWVPYADVNGQRSPASIKPNDGLIDTLALRSERSIEADEIYLSVPSRSTLDDVEFTTGNAEWACLTEALYFEARGESIPGIFAVAEVILNRRDSDKFPDTACAVISQGVRADSNACQFSYKCDAHPERFHEKDAYQLVGKIAQIALEERAPLITRGATYYHANFVNPSWARSFSKTAEIGVHYFYSG